MNEPSITFTDIIGTAPITAASGSSTFMKLLACKATKVRAVGQACEHRTMPMDESSIHLMLGQELDCQLEHCWRVEVTDFETPCTAPLHRTAVEYSMHFQ